MAANDLMRVLVTGADGFVAPYFLAALRSAGGFRPEIICTVRKQKTLGGNGERYLDVTDADAVLRIFADVKPTHVMHLAAISAPNLANNEPNAAWTTNVMGTLNVARAILTLLPQCTLIYAGSGLIYGASANSRLAVNEDSLLQPADEYAATKAAADLALLALAGRGLRNIRLRPFNHTGPGQSEAFALPSFAAQIARIERGLQDPLIRVGNLEVERDFLDVRDVAAAYVSAVQRAHKLAPATIINIASGQLYPVKYYLEYLLSKSSARISVEVDPTRLRSNDASTPRCSIERAYRLLGWKPTKKMEETLDDMLKYWRKKYAP